MLSSDKNVESIRQLCAELRQHVQLRLRLARLDLVDKMTAILTALILGIVLFLLSMIVILFLSYAAAMGLATLTGNIALAFVLIALFYAVVALMAYAFRERLIIAPVVRFLGSLLLDDQPEKDEDNDDR